MTVRALSDIQSQQPFRFPKGNKIRFDADFRMWEGVPSDRDFYIVGEAPSQHESFYLAADGYGVRENYGNGTIMVRKTDLPR